MDQSLYQAAATGDVALFDSLCSTNHSTSAELEQYLLSRTSDAGDNIIHIAVDSGQQLFISKVLEKVPLSSLLKVELICQQNRCGWNPLHRAASTGHLEIVGILIESYRKFSKLAIDEANTTCSETRVVVEDDDKQPPWAVKQTPLHMAIEKGHEDVAAYILSHDMDTLCNILDSDGKSPLYLAIEKGCEGIALQILTSDCSYKLEPLPIGNSTILHNASRITEPVALLLLEKHPELLRATGTRGETFLYSLAFLGQLESLQTLLKGKVFLSWSAKYRSLLYQKDNFGRNPIHGAVFSGNVEVVKCLVEAYFQVEPSTNANLDDWPWIHMDRHGETPLELATSRHQTDIVQYLLTLDSVIYSLTNHDDKNPLFIAVERGYADLAEILIMAPCCDSKPGPRGQNPFHVASKCPGIVGLLMEILGTDLIDEKDESGKTPLDYAAQVGDVDLVKQILKCCGMSNAPCAWIEACKGGHMEVLRMFMEKSDFKQVYCEQRDTPLHHMQLESKEEYEEFLAIPVFGQLKNALDYDGATPLHRAIERKNITFVELLLSKPDIDWNIKDKHGQTALNLLAKLCDEFPDWDAMCNRINMNPRLKTSYIPLKANMVEIRQTLSVVAALLATITFAAGFTIPGGYNDGGYAILAKRAAFIVFLLSDTYAMCCSMFVLFCLIWAMVCDPDKSVVLVDRSVFVLQQALYGTLVAFMSGVYTLVYHDSLWTAIAVCVMCSVIAVAATKSVLYYLIGARSPQLIFRSGQTKTDEENAPLV